MIFLKLDSVNFKIC